MIMYHLGPQLGVWIMQVSTFSSVLINRFHCKHFDCVDINTCIYASTTLIVMFTVAIMTIQLTID